MIFRSIFNTTLTIILLALWVNPLIGEVTVEPFGFAIAVGEEIVETELILTNNSEDDGTYRIGCSLIVNEDGQQQGPRRDDLGDQIREVQVGGGWWTGLAWDGERMWGVNYGNRNMVAVDLEEDEVEQIAQLNFGAPMGMTWDGGAFWVGDYTNGGIHYVDVEGNVIREIRSQNGHPTGISWDGENLWYCDYAGEQTIIRQISDQGEVLRTLNLEGIEHNWISLTWVPEHDDGHLWVLHHHGTIYQLNVDENDVEIVQQAQWQLQNNFGLEHDGETLWYPSNDGGNIWINIDDNVEELHLLNFEPEEGELPADESVEIVVSVTPEGYQAGIYNMLVEIELAEPEEMRDDFEEAVIEISIMVALESPTANVNCGVIDAATEEAIEGVTVELDQFIIIRFSDEDGACVFNNLPRGEYEFTFTALDYLPLTHRLNVQEEEEYDINVELLHSECNPDPDEITAELAPDTDMATTIDISNEGNGPLSYTVERRLFGDANADPWTLRISHMFGQDRDDSRIQGVVFADDHFYVAGAHGNEPAIYIFSREGEYIDLFIQPGEDRYGMKDLAWDGSLIWGSIGQTIYGMTLNGDVEVEFEGPFRPTSNLAWDPEHDLLWVSATTSDIAGLDRNGNLVSELDRQGLRMYGFGYWSDDPDDSPLYIFDKVRDVSDQVVHKMNVDNGELTEVSILEPEGGGSAAGAFITNEYDIYSWVFIAVANNGADDRVDIWQIDACKEWFLLEPMEGVIEARETQEFDLTLDATGLPPEVFEGELVFLHDGVGSETHIPVTLRVVEGPVQGERTIQLDIGWNMVSVNLQPDPDDIRVLMRELVEADLLILMKDGQGRFYSPEFDFCNIPGWNVADGYQVKMDDAGELMLAGITVMADDAIPLVDGWNLISYYPRTPVDAIVAFSGIVDQLLMAKDGVGRFYNPEWDFSNMGDLQELRGYQVKVTEDLELVYRLQAEDDDFILNIRDRQGKLPVHPLTGNNMSLLVKGGTIPNGEIGVYANGELVGSGVLEDDVCGIAVWGDDHTTPAIDGALEGASLELSLFDENGSHPVKFKTLAGNGLYQMDGFWAVELLDLNMIPDEFGIVSAYPNPFNSQTRVTYNLLEAAKIKVALCDLSGRRILDLESGYRNAGQYTAVIDGASLASGVYLVQLKANGDVSRSKITLLK